MELLEWRLVLSCDSDFTDSVLTTTCSAEDDSIRVRIDDGGALLLNEVAITGAPSTRNTDEIVIAAGAGYVHGDGSDIVRLRFENTFG